MCKHNADRFVIGGAMDQNNIFWFFDAYMYIWKTAKRQIERSTDKATSTSLNATRAYSVHCAAYSTIDIFTNPVNKMINDRVFCYARYTRRMYYLNLGKIVPRSRHVYTSLHVYGLHPNTHRLN